MALPPATLCWSTATFRPGARGLPRRSDPARCTGAHHDNVEAFVCSLRDNDHSWFWPHRFSPRSRLRLAGLLVNLLTLNVNVVNMWPYRCREGLSGVTKRICSRARRGRPDGTPAPPLPSRQPARSDPASGAQARRDRRSRRAYAARHRASGRGLASRSLPALRQQGSITSSRRRGGFSSADCHAAG